MGFSNRVEDADVLILEDHWSIDDVADAHEVLDIEQDLEEATRRASG